VYEPGAPALDPEVLRLGIPVLGICYGMQAMALALGGEVGKTGKAEFGKAPLELRPKAVLFRDLPVDQTCWMSHNDSVTGVPAGFEVTASSGNAPIAAMESRERGLYAVQFHPEVVHTPAGQDILKNFLYRGCEAPATWTAMLAVHPPSSPAIVTDEGVVGYGSLLRRAAAGTELLGELNVPEGAAVPALLDAGATAYALWIAGAGKPEALNDALALRMSAIEAAEIVFRVCHQLHGAVGFCDETTLSWLSRYSQPLRRLPLGLSATRDLLTGRGGRAGLTGLFA